jgi:PAS domain-containing protein
MKFNPYALIVLLPVLISGILAYYSYKRRHLSGALGFTLLLAAMTLYAFGYGLELMSTNLDTILFWIRVEYIGISFIPVFWMVLVLQFSGKERLLNRTNLAVLCLIPLTTIVLVFTANMHHLFYASMRVDYSGPFPMLAFTRGIWYWVQVAYTILSILGGSVYLLLKWRNSVDLFRNQALAMVVGSMGPLLLYILYIFGFSPIPHLDLSPFAFTFAGLVMGWSLFRHQLLDLMPVARDKLVENLDDGILVLDPEFRIVDINPAAQDFLNLKAPVAIGQRLESTLGKLPDVVTFCRAGKESLAEV